MAEVGRDLLGILRVDGASGGWMGHERDAQFARGTPSVSLSL